MKTHRVGTLTLGGILVALGLLFLLHIFLPFISYSLIFRLWPVVLIVLGVEVLIANRRSQRVEFRFDAGAVFLLILLILFSMGMAVADFCMQYPYGIYMR